jgi:hypothetical protein
MHFRLLKKISNKQKTILMPSQIGSRMAFQNAANAVKRAGLNPSNAVLSQSYLRFETACVAGATSYKFDVLVNETAYTPSVGQTTNKLNLQDAFVCNSLGVFFGVPPATSGATVNDYRLLTYPTIGLVTGAAGNFTTATAVQAGAFYNGFLSLTINQRTVVPYWDLARHYKVPTTQANMVTSTQFTGVPTTPTVTAFTAPTHLPDDSTSLADDAMYPVEPNIVFAGNKKHDLAINLPVATAAWPTNCRIVIIARGILAQNTTSVN